MNTDFANWLRYRAEEGLDVRGVVERRVVCPCCDGRGVTVHGFGGRYGGAYASYTADEWHELGEETQEDYRDGTFDAPCPDCGGANVVLELDRIDATLEIPTVPAFPMHESNAMRGIPSFDVRIRYLHIKCDGRKS